VADSEFDFESHDIKEAKKQLRRLQERHESLRKKVNREVMSKLERLVL
jgi:uncharacterized membrane protein (DUF106 family)